MAKKGSKSASKKAYLSGYDAVKQKVKKLERQLRLQPDNKQVADALARAKSGEIAKRNKSNKKGGWVDRFAFPWNHLSEASLAHLMNAGTARQKRFAQEASRMRHGVVQFNEQINKDKKQQ